MIMVLYTRVSRDNLSKKHVYSGLELLAEDRQETFFKIDLDIQVPPKDMQLDKWLIVTVNMKSSEKKSMNLFINLFYMNFMHKTGNTSGRPLYPADIDAYKKLFCFLKDNQDNVAHCAEEFRSETRCSDTVVDVMIHLAGKYKLHGGHWLCFFQELEKSVRSSQVFDYLMNAFCAPDNNTKLIVSMPSSHLQT
uniref:Uncharacterized protein n=1 Tax=Ditylenchus dipsaci TaxID=166011 RepID=A0A915EQK5_9BILA